MALKNYFLLNWKRFLVFLVVFSLVILLYNYLGTLTEWGDSAFFIVAVMVLPIYIIVFLILNLICWIFKKCLL